jgi:NitT/TauT family transport system permease protein
MVLRINGCAQMTQQIAPISVGGISRALYWDVIAIVLVLAFSHSSPMQPRRHDPLAELEGIRSLDPRSPKFAARTTLRMLAAMALSLLFTFTYATWAAKSPRAEVILIPLLDILQSVPILGFISVTVVYFMSLAPGLVLGAEFAAIFAIFTSQAWNMAFSFYQSLRTVPEELKRPRNFRFGAGCDSGVSMSLSPCGARLNMMMSMSEVGSSSSLRVNQRRRYDRHPAGIGSYIATAIAQRDPTAVGWAIGAMLVVIISMISSCFALCRLGGPFSL